MKNIILLLFLITLCGCNYRRPPIKTGQEGKVLPGFSLLLADSVTYFNTASIPDGQPVVLYYFSPQCPYCRAQMEEIIADMASLKDLRFFVLTNWPFSEMKIFYTHYQLNKYTNIVAGFDYTNFFNNYFNAPYVPYTAIYGRDKRLKKVFMGKIKGKQIKEEAEN